jgi:hypothetical protein
LVGLVVVLVLLEVTQVQVLEAMVVQVLHHL